MSLRFGSIFSLSHTERIERINAAGNSRQKFLAMNSSRTRARLLPDGSMFETGTLTDVCERLHFHRNTSHFNACPNSRRIISACVIDDEQRAFPGV